MYGAFSRYNRPQWRVRRGTHEARALWAKQREVSPMKQGVPQASLRAAEAAKWLEARGHAQRASTAPEHRAAEGEGGAKMQDDHCELWIACSPATSLSKSLFDKLIYCQSWQDMGGNRPWNI